MKKQEKMWIGAAAAIALAIPAIVSIGAAQPRRYYIPSGSMEPTLPLHSTIRVQRKPFASLADVRRGDIIVATHLDKASRASVETVKRVVALPHDKVRLSGTSLFINGRALPHALLRRIGKVTIYQESNGKAAYQVQYGDNTSPAVPFATVVPEDQLFCLGDNRDNANDSRYIGSVPFASVMGKRVP